MTTERVLITIGAVLMLVSVGFFAVDFTRDQRTFKWVVVPLVIAGWIIFMIGLMLAVFA